MCSVLNTARPFLIGLLALQLCGCLDREPIKIGFVAEITGRTASVRNAIPLPESWLIRGSGANLKRFAVIYDAGNSAYTSNWKESFARETEPAWW